ncbi:unnamed protein product [Closterium sp. NIES-65]|nr:unnamed protein product [Closterium sp. NIES-65]
MRISPRRLPQQCLQPKGSRAHSSLVHRRLRVPAIGHPRPRYQCYRSHFSAAAPRSVLDLGKGTLALLPVMVVIITASHQ